MDLAERAREVAAELESWSRRRWCHAQISRSRIDAIVKTIDTARKPRTRVVDEVRGAARLSIQLYDDYCANRELDNVRLSSIAAASHDAFSEGYARAISESPELRALAGTISGAAWAARNAIGVALHALDRDGPLRSFYFRHSFTSPVYAFEYRGRALIAGGEYSSPYLGVTELYLAGCFPLGYLDDHFVVFAP